MATLITARSKDEVKVATVSILRKWYNELADNYNKIVDESLRQCPKCGKWLSTENAFYMDRRYVAGRFFICKKCIQDMVEQRKNANDESHECKETVIAACRFMDIPYFDEIYSNCVTACMAQLGERYSTSPFLAYIRKVKSLQQYDGMTFADSELPDDGVDENASERMIQIFGSGFSAEDYKYLENEYDDWCTRTEVDTKSQQTYVKEICLQSLEIHKDRRAGKDVSKKIEVLDRLMSGANLQPKQNVGNAATDSLSLGELIDKWEQNEPIPEPSEEFKDVDKIGEYIRVWFAGHLSHALGLQNAYSKEYDDYIKQYTVEKPVEIEDGQSEDIYDALFGSDGE